MAFTEYEALCEKVEEAIRESRNASAMGDWSGAHGMAQAARYLAHDAEKMAKQKMSAPEHGRSGWLDGSVKNRHVGPTRQPGRVPPLTWKALSDELAERDLMPNIVASHCPTLTGGAFFVSGGTHGLRSVYVRRTRLPELAAHRRRD